MPSTYTVELNDDEETTLQQIAAMAGVPAQTIVQGLVRTMPFKQSVLLATGDWRTRCAYSGRKIKVDMSYDRDELFQTTLELIGMRPSDKWFEGPPRPRLVKD